MSDDACDMLRGLIRSISKEIEELKSTVNAALLADTAVTESPGRDRAHIQAAMTTRPVHAGTRKLSGKTPSNAALLAPFREKGAPGPNCGIVAW